MRSRETSSGRCRILTEEELTRLLDHTGVTLPTAEADRLSPIMLIILHVLLLLILIDLLTRIH